MEENGVLYRMQDMKTEEDWLKKRSVGIGASEAASMCNASKYESQSFLWELKTGARPPKKQTEAMTRGKVLEAPVRDRFMNKYGWAFDLEYYQYGMYYRTDYPMLYATLDGVLVAKVNATITLPNGITIAIKEGERYILEIKNPAPRTFEGYKEWDFIPVEYKYQAGQQMFCSGITKHILIANITGDFQQDEVDERYFLTTSDDLVSEIDEIKTTAPVFWNSVKKNERPIVPIELKDVNFIMLDAKVKMGTLIDNFAEVESSIRQYADAFRGMQFTDDQLKLAKSKRAELNSKTKVINDYRLGIERQFNAPAVAFKEKCDSLIKLIKDVIVPIDNQIKEMENGNKDAKKKLVLAEIDKILDSEYKDFKRIVTSSKGVPFNDKWLNATYSMKNIGQDVRNILDRSKLEWETLLAFKSTLTSEEWTAVFSEYITSGRNLHAALVKKDAFAEAKEIQRQIDEAEAPRKAVKPTIEETPVITAEEIVEPTVANVEPTEGTVAKESRTVAKPVDNVADMSVNVAPQKVYTKVVEFSHTNLDEFNLLVRYLVEHGFKCREVK